MRTAEGRIYVGPVGLDREGIDAPRDPMTPVFRRIWKFLTRPLWYEPEGEREHRRKRLLIYGPFGVLVGTALGITLGITEPLQRLWLFVFLTLSGGLTGFLIVYVVAQFESLARLTSGARSGPRALALRIGADGLTGALFGQLGAFIHDANLLAGLAAGLSLLMGYSVFAQKVLFGDWLDRIALGMGRGRVVPEYSYAATLAARGEVDAAVEAYVQGSEEHGGDAEPLMRAGWLLYESGRPDQARELYGAALRSPRMDSGHASVALRMIVEICEGKLNEPWKAIPELEVALDDFPDAPVLEWAKPILRDLYRAEGLPLDVEQHARIAPRPSPAGRTDDGPESAVASGKGVARSDAGERPPRAGGGRGDAEGAGPSAAGQSGRFDPKRADPDPDDEVEPARPPIVIEEGMIFNEDGPIGRET